MPRKKSTNDEGMEVKVPTKVTEYDGTPAEDETPGEDENETSGEDVNESTTQTLDLPEFTAGCVYCATVASRRTQEEADAWLKNHLQICPTKALTELCESAQKMLDAIKSGIETPKYNLSALQFQAAMLQPCNGQILPAAVRDEIDRLYGIENKYNIARRAQRALTLIVEHDPVMLNLPEDPDERLLLMEMMNEWYTREYPERKPLALKSLRSS